MMRIGLTGSIAAGKSEVSRRLRALGAYVVDADAVAREVVQPGTPGLAELCAVFGASLRLPDGALDRKALSALVFSDAAARARLNAVLHPRIRARMEALAAKSGEARVVFDVPLLFESGMDAAMDLIWLVDAPEEARIARMRARDGFGEAEALARVRAQLGDAEKRARADVIIVNGGTLAELYRKVDRLWLSIKESSCS